MGIQRKRYLIAAVLLAAVLIIVLASAATQRRSSTNPTPSPTPTITKGNSTADEPSPTPTPGRGGSATPAVSPSAAVPKPSLAKSSGNAPGSSIPAGVAVEFDCTGAAGYSCEVVLTKVNDSNQKIALGSKPIVDNGRGEYFALWQWTSVSGSWNVTAVQRDASGKSTSSDPQKLEVQ